MPARTGGGLAMRAGVFLDGFARAFRVHVLVLPVIGLHGRDDGFAVERADSVRVLDMSAIDHVHEARAALATPAGRARMQATHPLPSLCAFLGQRVSDGIATTVRNGNFSVVHVMRLYLVPSVAELFDIPGDARPLLSLDVDDDDAALHAQLGLADEADRFRRLAAWGVPQFDVVASACADDALLTVPNAVAAPRQLVVTSAPGPRLIFVGDLGYVPNADAAIRLCTEILPAVQAVAPAASATIVGARPPSSVRALEGRHGVVVAGDVADVSVHYAAADVAVVPLDAGSGARTKIVEAFAHRVPVVSTAVGAAGLGETHRLLLRAETSEDFVAAILRLHGDLALRTALVDAAEDEFRGRFSFDVVASSIASTWALKARDPVTVVADE